MSSGMSTIIQVIIAETERCCRCPQWVVSRPSAETSAKGGKQTFAATSRRCRDSRILSKEMVVAYAEGLEAMMERGRAIVTEDQLSEFMISRLAELVVVLLNEHARPDAGFLKDREEAQAILVELGSLAAEHGQDEWMAMLRGLASKIKTADQLHEPEQLFFGPPERCVATLTYHW